VRKVEKDVLMEHDSSRHKLSWLQSHVTRTFPAEPLEVDRLFVPDVAKLGRLLELSILVDHAFLRSFPAVVIDADKSTSTCARVSVSVVSPIFYDLVGGISRLPEHSRPVQPSQALGLQLPVSPSFARLRVLGRQDRRCTCHPPPFDSVPIPYPQFDAVLGFVCESD